MVNLKNNSEKVKVGVCMQRLKAFRVLQENVFMEPKGNPAKK